MIRGHPVLNRPITLPYLPGRTFYRLAQINHHVTKSSVVVLTPVHTNNGTIPLSKWEHPLGFHHHHTLSVSLTKHQLQQHINHGHNDRQISNQENPVHPYIELNKVTKSSSAIPSWVLSKIGTTPQPVRGPIWVLPMEVLKCKCKYEFARVENVSMENTSTIPQRWKTQVRKIQVPVCSSH